MSTSDQNLDSNSYTKLSSTESSESLDKDSARNPITGMGLNGDGVGGLKPKVPKSRMGNPVTGEGYRPGLTDYEEFGQKHRRLGESRTDRY